MIPCLDVHDGRTVKGINFIDLIDAGDPVEQAKLYNDLGADEICFLDISATNEGRKTLFNIVSKVAESCFIPLTVGGGIKENSDINNLLVPWPLPRTAIAEDSNNEDVPMARALSEASANRQMIAPQGLVVRTGPLERDVPMATTITDR